MESSREKLNIVLIGHENSGKTSVLVKIFVKDSLNEVVGAKRIDESPEKNKVVMNEQLQQVKNNLKVEAYKNCSFTDKYLLTIIDTPGDKNYLENMITGLCQADCAVLVVSAKEGEFEEAIKEESIGKHIMLARSMGIGLFICLVNKMDATEPNFSMERFDKIKKETTKIFKMKGLRPEKIPFIPVSGLKGDNMIGRTLNMPWFQGWKTRKHSGETFLDAINSTSIPYITLRNEDKPVRIVINDVKKLDGADYATLSGLVQMGKFQIGTEFTISPGNIKARLQKINNNRLVKQAHAGDYISFDVTSESLEDIKRGMVAGLSLEQPPIEAETFEAKILIVNDSTEDIKIGYKPVVHSHSTHIPCEFVELKERIDAKTGKIIEKNPSSLKPVCGAVVVLKPTKPMCVETFKFKNKLGSVVITDQEKTIVAVGAITNVKHKESSI